MNEFYKNSDEHLYDELLLIDLLIHAQVIKFRADNTTPKNNLQGLYISEEEIDHLLKHETINNDWVNLTQDVDDNFDKITNAIKKLSKSIKTKIAKTLENNNNLKLIELAHLYNLNSFETNVLTICLAPQFDSKYRKLFAYLQNDVTRKNPSVELILNLLCSTFKEKLSARQYFNFQSPLFKNNILQFIENLQEPDKPLITRELKINTRIVGYILGQGLIDDDISLISEFYSSNKILKDIVVPDDIREKLGNFVSYFKANELTESFVFSFYGPYGSLKLESAGAVCAELKAPLLVVDLQSLDNTDLYFERALDLVLREAKILPAGIYFKNCDFLFLKETEKTYFKRYFLKELDKNSKLVFIDSISLLPIHGEFQNQRVITLEFTVPEYAMRKNLWTNYLKNFTLSKNIDIKEIANKYNLTSGQIRDIVTTAHTYALWRDTANTVITQKDIEEACHIHSNQKLSKMAVRIKPKHQWDDLILESSAKIKLNKLVNMFKHKHIVYNEWGFDDKLSLGKGISALFYGESGTGKTLAAEIIANELAMDMYKVDLAGVVSKYIGETEKNLDVIFKEAESSNCILFFDEADALFGKRTEIKDSHDRYANTEVSYLLQKIDEYRGMVIMATNIIINMDPAFERRLHFSINFPIPDEYSRLLIWKNIFPDKTPLAEDIDFEYLAKTFTISGGNIKNIALSSAFSSAESGDEIKIITMEKIIEACKSEYEKIGRLWDNQYKESI